MPGETLTFHLDGEVSLMQFRRAVEAFSEIVSRLTHDVAKDDGVRWIIESLDGGSARETVRGISHRNVASVHKVVAAFEDVATHMQRGDASVGRTKAVQRSADEFLRMLDEGLLGVRFETEERDFTVARPADGARFSVPVVTSLGAVDGKIQTVSDRGSLRFTLYDTMNDRAISCYLRKGDEDRLRGLWGHRAIVEGRLSRDGSTGRPLTIRDITDIVPMPDVDTDWRAGIGAVPTGPNGLSAEDAIRRVRDEW